MKKVYLQGIAWDQKSSFLEGAKAAPDLIRGYLWSDATNTFSELGEDIAPPRLQDVGTLTPTAYEQIYEATQQKLAEHEGPLLTLGGDHSISFPVVKAVAEKYGRLNLLHVDAHADLYDNFEGDPFSHACPFARIMESGLASRLVQVGIRTLNPHQREQAERFGVEVFEMRHQAQWELPVLEGPVYLSLDLDGIDPAFAPGVSHHEPGGLTPREVIALIQQIQGELVGADVVEYNPTRDVQGITGALAAKLVKEIAGKMLSQG